MRLAGAAVADAAQIALLLDPFAPRQFQHFLLADLRGEREVECLKVFENREIERIDSPPERDLRISR